MDAIFPTKIGATCSECQWMLAWVDVSPIDHNTGQKAWTEAQAKVRRVNHIHALQTGHTVVISRIHSQIVRVLS